MENKTLKLDNLTKKEITTVQNNDAKDKVKDKNISKTIYSFFNSFFSKNKKQKVTNFDTNNNNDKTEITNQISPQNADSVTQYNKNDKGFTKFFKIKQVKSAFIVLIFALVALIILNSSFGTNFAKKDNAKNEGYITSLEYCEKLEKKLMEVLGEIGGVGKIKVMVTVENGPELKIANSIDERTNTTTNGNTTTTNSTIISDPIIINASGSSNPLIICEIVPKVTGVVVVASGAKDMRIRMSLLDAVVALLDISSNKVQIYY